MFHKSPCVIGIQNKFIQLAHYIELLLPTGYPDAAFATMDIDTRQLHHMFTVRGI